MKNNLEKSVIFNRRIIIEIRYSPLPKILDLKGTIIEKLVEEKIFKEVGWQVNNTGFSFRDSVEINNAREFANLDLKTLLFTSSKIDSIDSYYKKFNKLKKIFIEYFDKVDIKRIGCRIQGTYSVKSTTFTDIFNSFKKSFPDQFFIEQFPSKDIKLTVEYQNGKYDIGPIKEEDQFVKSAFPFNDSIKKPGIAIDTDNFLLKNNNSPIEFENIKDVFYASLAVEKSLYEKMKDF